MKKKETKKSRATVPLRLHPVSDFMTMLEKHELQDTLYSYEVRDTILRIKPVPADGSMVLRSYDLRCKSALYINLNQLKGSVSPV
jgi:hypothetical protein